MSCQIISVWPTPQLASFTLEYVRTPFNMTWVIQTAWFPNIQIFKPTIILILQQLHYKQNGYVIFILICHSICSASQSSFHSSGKIKTSTDLKNSCFCLQVITQYGFNSFRANFLSLPMKTSEKRAVAWNDHGRLPGIFKQIISK